MYGVIQKSCPVHLFVLVFIIFGEFILLSSCIADFLSYLLFRIDYVVARQFILVMNLAFAVHSGNFAVAQSLESGFHIIVRSLR